MSHGIFLCVLLYVDNLFTNGNNPTAITQFKNHLSNCFHMKDLGSSKYFLRIKVARNAYRLYLSRCKYALDIISETGLSGSKPASILIELNHHLAIDKATFLTTPDRYMRLVGCLTYLTVTRPELVHFIHTLAQFMQTMHLCH